MHSILPFRLCTAPISKQIPLRAFSTTISRQNLIPKDAIIPPFPYGPARWYKQSNLGLYGGQRIQFGNNVSERTKTKTRRSWSPNVQHKQLYSEILGRKIRVRLTTRVLRTIDKVGGLDEYLLGDKPSRIKELGPRGWMLRWRLMQVPKVQKRFAAARRKMGWIDFGKQGSYTEEPDPPAEETSEAVKRFDQELDEEERRLEKLERRRAAKDLKEELNGLRYEAQETKHMHQETVDTPSATDGMTKVIRNQSSDKATA